MDGKLAILFAALSAYEGVTNYDEVDYFSQKPLENAHISLELGRAHVEDPYTTNEIGGNYAFGYEFGPWRPIISASITEKGGAWIGYGGELNYQKNNVFFSSYLIPGVYIRGDDVDLGSSLEFKSGVAVGYEFNNKSRVSVGYSHRSNNDWGSINQGTESYYLRYALPLD